GAVAYWRKEAHRHAEERRKLRIPGTARDVEQQRTRRICGIGCVHATASEPSQQETIDGAEGELACLCGAAGAIDMLEEPGDLAGREIRVEHEPGFGGDAGLKAALAQCCAEIRGAAVLPDDGVVDRLAGGAIPDDCGLALIGDADA